MSPVACTVPGADFSCQRALPFTLRLNSGIIVIKVVSPFQHARQKHSEGSRDSLLSRPKAVPSP